HCANSVPDFFLPTHLNPPFTTTAFPVSFVLYDYLIDAQSGSSSSTSDFLFFPQTSDLLLMQDNGHKKGSPDGEPLYNL
ncbi:MAG: hypothetical protein ACI4PQ_06450, partial [Butyricicoccaceae bacterium]